MTQTRISLENIDGEKKGSKQSQGEKVLNEWEQPKTDGFLKTVWQQLGSLKILSNGWWW